MRRRHRLRRRVIPALVPSSAGTPSLGQKKPQSVHERTFVNVTIFHWLKGTADMRCSTTAGRCCKAQS